MKREQRNFLTVAWYAVAPHADKKKWPSLKAFLGGEERDLRKPALDIDTAMRKWRAVMAAVTDQAKPKARQRRDSR